MRYVEDDNAEVREAAALTCCQLFVKDPICYQTSNHAIQVVGEVMEKLLTVAIADPGKCCISELFTFGSNTLRSAYSMDRFELPGCAI